jgi:hypothetical protein
MQKLAYNAINQLKRNIYGWVLVTHTCNLSYWGGRDQEDGGWKPSWANSLGDPILKILKIK